MSNYHVTKDPSGGWDVKKEGSTRISGNFETQKEAEKEAKQYSSNNGGGEVKIHGLDGKIRDSDTVPPGNDPNPPLDQKY